MMKKIGISLLPIAVAIAALGQLGCISAAKRAGSKMEARRTFAGQTACQRYDSEHLHSVEVGPPGVGGWATNYGEAVEVTGCGESRRYLCYHTDESGGSWHCD